MEYFFILIVLVLGIAAGIFLTKKIGFFSKKTNINITSTVKEILPISEYASLVYQYSDVVTHSDVNKLFNINIPFTEKKAIYTVEGTIKLGFNGKNIKIGNSYNKIIVYMPKIEILSHEIYPETFKLYDERSGIFNRYGLKDANAIQITQKNEQVAKVYKNPGLFTQARESAQEQFNALLGNIPDIKDKYKIVFEWENERIQINGKNNEYEALENKKE
jgi:hypothetical protein